MLKARHAYPYALLPILAALQGFAVFVLSQRLAGEFVVAALVSALPLLIVLPLVYEQAACKFHSLWARLNWLHSAWLALFLSGLVFRVRGVDSILEQPIDAWALYRITLVFLTALLLGAWLLRKKIPLSKLFSGLVAPACGYAVVCVASTFWSVHPAWTLYRSIEYLAALAVLAALVWTARSIAGYKTVLDWTWTLYTALLVSVWIGVLVAPELAIRRGEGVGVLGFAITGLVPAVGWNTVGEVAAVVAVVCFCRIVFHLHQRSLGAFYFCGLAVALLTLIFSSSRSSIAGFLMGLFAVLFAAKRTKALAATVVMSLVIASQTPLGGIAWQYFLRGQTPEQFYTFSGRLQLWNYGIEQLSAEPLTGFGAYAGSRFVALADYSGQTRAAASTMLNTYLEVLLGSSLWGLLPLVIAAVGTWWVLVRCARRVPPCSPERLLALEAIGVLGVITVRSWFTVKFIWHPALLFLVVLGCAEVLRRTSVRAAPGRLR